MTPDQLIEQCKLAIRWAESVKAGKAIEIECKSRVVRDVFARCPDPTWDIREFEYREKPRPFECYVVDKNGLYASTNKKMAELHAGEVGGTVVHMREVVE